MLLYNGLSQLKYGALTAGQTLTLTSQGGGAILLALSRGAVGVSCLLLCDYWSEGYTLLSGTLPSTVRVTKSASSNSVTIVNNTSNAIAYTCL